MSNWPARICIGAELRRDINTLCAQGMRIGKAVRRVAGHVLTSDAEVQSATEALAFAFDVSASVDAYARAYDDVTSCMHGRGADLHLFYARESTGVDIATLSDSNGKVVARALVRNGQYNKAYGEKHYALIALLKLSGFVRSADWLAGADLSPATRTWPVHYEAREIPPILVCVLIFGKRSWVTYGDAIQVRACSARRSYVEVVDVPHLDRH